MERLDGGSTEVGSPSRVPPPDPPPPSSPSIALPLLGAGHYRQEAERFGDLAIEMIERGEEDMARGATIVACANANIYQRIQVARQRLFESAQDRRCQPRETPAFLRGTKFGLLIVAPFWVAVACAVLL